MYRNLLQAAHDTPVFITAILDEPLASKLERKGVEVGAEIVIADDHQGADLHEKVVITNQNGLQIPVSREAASLIIIRYCEVCWACGECMVEEG